MTATCKRYRTKLVLYVVANHLQGDSVASPCRLVLPGFFFVSVPSVFFPPPAHPQERPYFVPYDPYLEETGNLKLQYFSHYGSQPRSDTPLAPCVECRYWANASTR